MKNCKVTFDFPADEYEYLLLCCEKLGVTIGDFVSKAVIEAIESQEDEWLFKKD